MGAKWALIGVVWCSVHDCSVYNLVFLLYTFPTVHATAGATLNSSELKFVGEQNYMYVFVCAYDPTCHASICP